MDQKGIGPVLAAGLLAHLDITRAPTAASCRSFAGLNPTVKWEKGQRRPWNATLKTLCWRVGDSFVKVSNRDDATYGQAYRQRKLQEVERSEGGLFADQATISLERPKLSTLQHAAYDAGKLPAGRLDLRARRWAVKLFLAHLHAVMFEDTYGTPPPMPYVIEQLGHVHYLGPEGWPRP